MKKAGLEANLHVVGQLRKHIFVMSVVAMLVLDSEVCQNTLLHGFRHIVRVNGLLQTPQSCH